MNTKQRFCILLILTLLLSLPLSTSTKADSNVSTQIAAKIDSPYVMVNKHTQILDTPAVLINGKVFIPAKNIASYLGTTLFWNAKLKSVDLKTAHSQLQFYLDKKTIGINGVMVPFKDKAFLSKDRLMVELAWFAEQTGTTQTYNPVNKLFTLDLIKTPVIVVDTLKNVPPIAKFTFGKTSFRLGETIQYVDLSYDPDAEGLRYEWIGKQEVFFKPGTYPISLRVYDQKGNVSALFTKNLIIEDTLLLTEEQYPVYNQPVGTAFKTNWDWVWNHFTNLPYLSKEVTIDPSRTLLLSDSPETFKETGILYQDNINGKARLYADHMNGTKDKIRFNIQVRNLTDQPVTLRTTNKGEVTPSVYANLIGHVASVDFLMHNTPTVAPLVIAPGQTAVYSQMPDLYPGQGINLFYDVETDGQLQVAFVASLASSLPVSPFDTTKYLEFDGHLRGTFPSADKRWDVDLSTFREPSRLSIGDGKEDAYVRGYDVQRQMEVDDMGNYGTIYTIHSDKPRKMAVMLIAKGGPFKGPFVINGQFMMAPASGVISAFQSIQILARTTGTEESFDLVFTPPAGSAFPIDLIFYPLD
ncbi:copper amine oxidase N-terminal domain-containing protein [Paenibacillus psychroresistens]|uniref:Copper amine oxidase N-terminal domain-containing protein n=1 Tax=Paenibacillus psychroresistens TaxID=1778678 RepID=A0A6B8RQC0_9BACL|nr:stalk domain-containing protein [Paenibacillus psychroresistens]QGQ97892.1 copper amine oxidase N-terminal domain-containing protein [Paenibacillus psychroresistens]